MLGELTPSVSRGCLSTRGVPRRKDRLSGHHQPQPLVLILGSKAQILP